MKAYIHKCQTLSVLDTFESGILQCMPGPAGKELVEPDYKTIIPAGILRRMSKLIRMGVATALKVKGVEETAGIIVGTGIGCFDNSAIFSREFLENPDSLLSPTAFIQSTDNTIAGQIGLVLEDHSYNITYFHKGISFESALLDAMLLSAENNSTVLVGSVDEKIDILELRGPDRAYFLGEGASFFLLGQQREKALAAILACRVISSEETSVPDKIHAFLEKNSLEQPDLILHGNSFPNRVAEPGNIGGIKTFNYSSLCGIYFTNPGFGMQLGVEILSNPTLASSKGIEAEKILLVNNFYDTDFGFIYLTRA